MFAVTVCVNFRQTKITGKGVVYFDVLYQLLIIHSSFIKYRRQNTNMIRRRMTIYIWLSHKCVIKEGNNEVALQAWI